MSNDTPQYILRKPFQISFHVTEDEPADPNFIDTPFQMFSAKAFDHFFVEVDMVQLRKQVEEVVQEAIRLEKNAQIISTKRAVVARATDRILGLLTQGSET